MCLASRFGHFTHFINTLLLASLTRLGSSGSTSFYLLRFFFFYLFLYFFSLFCFNSNLCAFCFLSVYARIFRPDNTPARDKAAWSNVLPAGQIAFAMLCSALCSPLARGASTGWPCSLRRRCVPLGALASTRRSAFGPIFTYEVDARRQLAAPEVAAA